jgi:hypothetical protein
MAIQNRKAATNFVELPKFLDLLPEERVFCRKKSIRSPKRIAFRLRHRQRPLQAAFLEDKGR